MKWISEENKMLIIYHNKSETIDRFVALNP